MSEFWQHVLIAAAVILIAWLVAKFVDWRISRRNLPPEIVTRYRVLRRTICRGDRLSSVCCPRCS